MGLFFATKIKYNKNMKARVLETLRYFNNRRVQVYRKRYIEFDLKRK